jgi:hypothetical protein
MASLFHVIIKNSSLGIGNKEEVVVYYSPRLVHIAVGISHLSLLHFRRKESWLYFNGRLYTNEANRNDKCKEAETLKAKFQCCLWVAICGDLLSCIRGVLLCVWMGYYVYVTSNWILERPFNGHPSSSIWMIVATDRIHQSIGNVTEHAMCLQAILAQRKAARKNDGKVVWMCSHQDQSHLVFKQISPSPERSVMATGLSRGQDCSTIMDLVNHKSIAHTE